MCGGIGVFLLACAAGLFLLVRTYLKCRQAGTDSGVESGVREGASDTE